MSIAGGLHLALERLEEVGGETLQIFVRNQRRWESPVLSEEKAALFRDELSKWAHLPVAVHSSYLINLAAPDGVVARKSLRALREELERTARLNIPFFIMHPGAHMGAGVSAGLRRLVRNLDAVFSECGDATVRLLLENTAGQGSQLGASFEELAYVLSHSRFGNRLGVCFDTCHAVAAGYGLGDETAYRETMGAVASTVGLEQIHFFHLNDSRHAAGSRKDRHEHIGRGFIGRDGFRLLLEDPRFSHHPMVLETPKGPDLEQDKTNLELLRLLAAEAGGQRCRCPKTGQPGVHPGGNTVA